MAGGKQINLHGVNWFGFNAHATYLHGLWVGQASANSDFAAIAWQFKLLGFNAIRLPFLFADLWTPAEQIGGRQWLCVGLDQHMPASRLRDQGYITEHDSFFLSF